MYEREEEDAREETEGLERAVAAESAAHATTRAQVRPGIMRGIIHGGLIV
jgi:hypothetical protein